MIMATLLWQLHAHNAQRLPGKRVCNFRSGPSMQSGIVPVTSQLSADRTTCTYKTVHLHFRDVHFPIGILYSITSSTETQRLSTLS
jgi:hypothetical protein